MVVDASYNNNSTQLLMRVSFNNMAQFTQVGASVGVYCGTDFVGFEIFGSRGSDNQFVVLGFSLLGSNRHMMLKQD